MTSRQIIRQKKKMLRSWLKKWFGSNRGTHWSVAGSVAVIVLGTYLIYSYRDGSNTTPTAVSANPLVTATMGAAGGKR
jgi:hypothetical protein